MGEILPKDIPWTKLKVTKVDPQASKITTENHE
jgi:hypothetical protein